jgi:hypothetical protein
MEGREGVSGGQFACFCVPQLQLGLCFMLNFGKCNFD